MPHHSQLAEAPSTTSYGQVIEYIAGEPPLPRNFWQHGGISLYSLRRAAIFRF